MQFSRLVFPAPKPPSYSQERLVGELLYVPKDFRDCPYKYMKKERGRSRQGSNTQRVTTPRRSTSRRRLRAGSFSNAESASMFRNQKSPAEEPNHEAMTTT